MANPDIIRRPRAAASDVCRTLGEAPETGAMLRGLSSINLGPCSPEMNGYQSCQAIRHMNDAAQRPYPPVASLSKGDRQARPRAARHASPAGPSKQVDRPPVSWHGPAAGPSQLVKIKKLLQAWRTSRFHGSHRVILVRRIVNNCARNAVTFTLTQQSTTRLLAGVYARVPAGTILPGLTPGIF